MSTGYSWRLGWRGDGWTAPSNLAVGDFNADGRKDIVYIMATSSTTVDANTLLSTGSGWATGWQVTGWAKPVAVTAGDFDGS
jgi:hypothetical protein